MLIKVTVENFKSFSEPTEMTMISSTKIQKGTDHRVKIKSTNILKYAVIYGANAAGKSNLIDFFWFLKSTLNDTIPMVATKWFCKCKEENINKNSSFEIQFTIGDKFYAYGFTALLNQRRITSEWLYELYQNGNAKCLFERNEEEKWECLSHGWTLDNAEGLIKFSPKISLNPNSRTIKLKYCCGGGKAGNISAGQTFVPAISDGLISSAVNPFSFQGGTDRESNFNAEKRLSYEFRHQNRPVTKKDYEDFLIDDDVILIEIKSTINGGMNIKATVSSELINKDVIKKRIYSKLTGILPIDMGEIRVKVVYRNE